MTSISVDWLGGLELWQVLLIALAGLWAGAINTVVGSGTFVTFPTLLALVYPPVTAAISNAMGLVAGNASGAWGYRSQLKGYGRQVRRLLPASLLGGVLGAMLLLNLSASVFQTVAPVLIVIALLLIIFQPRLQRWVAARRQRGQSDGIQPDAVRPAQNSGNGGMVAAGAAGLLLTVLVFLTGVYGGYFVAAQGIILVGILGIFLNGTMQSANAMKNVLVLGVNIVAACSYLIFAFDRIAWPVVTIIAVSSLLGGYIGSKIGQRLSPVVLRGAIVVLGLVALYFMIAGQR
ncbi:sulfite exporter TauE/SafE family protein [Acaricomes phytoseiuli]|uniref:sulfite exporter TauE/SafE family protein n=1 Tax=Acaricomes phytoseiuli TaxID=291968 RepID=UPI0022222770|nr:sulfite exporter TauE/SafE family protein [Acaricomes phytoseiuli]MCW1250258.1 sulfite exporter TauE/SafE family protein [Acaricomes phytoseiuli]